MSIRAHVHPDRIPPSTDAFHPPDKPGEVAVSIEGLYIHFKNLSDAVETFELVMARLMALCPACALCGGYAVTPPICEECKAKENTPPEHVSEGEV